jgi:rhodanese-related sulfurtransferase
MVTRISPRSRAIGYAAGLLLVAALTLANVLKLSSIHGPSILDPTNPKITLEDVESEIIRRYPVDDVSASKLASMMATSPVTLFDVRTREEFEAGHLPGAIRIEPGSSAKDILSAHRDKLGGQPVVFYCAVGVRSSQVLMQTLRELAPLTRGQIFNLRGGVFRWAAEGRVLVKGDEPGKPHPYDANWGKLLARTVPGS